MRKGAPAGRALPFFHPSAKRMESRMPPYSAKSPACHASSWRDTLPVHRAAELFPLMSPDELRALGEDIVKNGLTSAIVLWQPDPKSPMYLLDGRNRLDAIEIATGCPVEIGAPS